MFGRDPRVDPVTEEFRTPPVCETFEKLCENFGEPGDTAGDPVGDASAHPNTSFTGPSSDNREAVLLYALQVCRRMSTFTLERTPYLCSVLLAPAGVETVQRMKDAQIGYATLLRLKSPLPFVHSSDQVQSPRNWRSPTAW